jgi:hypothetical protein
MKQTLLDALRGKASEILTCTAPDILLPIVSSSEYLNLSG